MATVRNYRFCTDRIAVNEWHSFTADEWPPQDVACVVQEILTERVTESLPAAWQGPYDRARALQWIDERDNEGTTLLAINKSSGQAMGLVILFEPEASARLRLGYMLAESAWGKGFASELVGGFVNWCRHNDIQSITGGVERDNVASRRVLEKCGFLPAPNSADSGEQLFTLELT